MRSDCPEAGCLRKFRRFAIWNREKHVVIIAMCVWLADVAFLIYGKYFFMDYRRTFTKLVIIS